MAKAHRGPDPYPRLIAPRWLWVLGSLLIGFTVVQFRILSRLEFRTASAKE